MNIFKTLILAVVVLTASQCKGPGTKKNAVQVTKDKYQCLPCGQDCDTIVSDSAGECARCHMELVKSSTIRFGSIQPAIICRYLQEHPQVVLLDVRTREEFEGRAEPDFGRLKKAINVPIQELRLKLQALDSLKNREIIVYCSHSHRSPQASYILTQHGFTNVTNLEGGMSRMTDRSCMQ